ncbi:MAG: MBL fold metallo-hydrolase [Malacoplasma sp.]|nr:MBL fold metallo-hydrolase [Malacoplasma sp.]
MRQEIIKNIWAINGNSYENNCYIIVKNNGCVIIDPSYYYDDITKFVSEKKLKVLAIILTHSHFDHYGSSCELANKFGCKIYAHKNEKPMFDFLNMADECGFEVPKLDWKNIELFDSLALKFDDINLKVIPTPGHTTGGVVLAYNNAFFTGDTLFVDSIGRTDFKGGDMKAIMQSVHKIIKAMHDNDYLLCGHGQVYPQFKTVKQINPYVRHCLNKYE